MVRAWFTLANTLFQLGRTVTSGPADPSVAGGGTPGCRARRSTRRDRELAPGGRQIRLDLEPLTRIAPIELATQDGRHPRRDGGSAIGEFLRQTRASGEDVIE
jgi:hypothetical protein